MKITSEWLQLRMYVIDPLFHKVALVHQKAVCRLLYQTGEEMRMCVVVAKQM